MKRRHEVPASSSKRRAKVRCDSPAAFAAPASVAGPASGASVYAMARSSSGVRAREDIEAWLVAAHTRGKDIESLEDPAGALAAHGIIGTAKNGKPHKSSEAYRALAVPLVRLARDAKQVRAVPELKRFVDKLRARARTVRGSKR